MEPSISTMKLEDYTSQRLVEPGGTEVENPALLGSPTGGLFDMKFFHRYIQTRYILKAQQ